MTLAARPSRTPRWLLPAILLVALLVMVGATVTLAGRGRDKEPPRAGQFSRPAPARPVVALDVQQVRDGRLTLGGGDTTVEATPASGVQVFVLRSVEPREVVPGDWVTVSGISNEVLNFTVRLVVIIPAALGPNPDDEGIPRLPSGFAGHEASRDQRQRPLLSGRVERVEGRTITFTGRGGTMALEIVPNTQVHRLTPGSPADIHEGDRLAYLPAHPGATPSDATTLLVLPAPAQR